MRTYLDNGIPFWEWRMQQIRWQCDEYLSTRQIEEAPLARKAIWTPRDDYGWKGKTQRTVSIA